MPPLRHGPTAMSSSTRARTRRSRSPSSSPPSPNRSVMSYSSIFASTVDQPLVERIQAAIAKEAFHNEELGDTEAGRLVVETGSHVSVLGAFLWLCCVDFEAEYEFALNGGNENPGGDPSVITDAELLSSVQANWPGLPVEPPVVVPQ